MNNYIEPRGNMSDKQWDNYCKHLEKNSYYEQQKIELEKEENNSYRKMLIDNILDNSEGFTKEELRKKSTITLERIYDMY